jgi:hypothetical protein
MTNGRLGGSSAVALLLSLATLHLACGPSTTPSNRQEAGDTPPLPAAAPATDATAGSSGAGRVAGDAPPLLDAISVIGTWSFDRTRSTPGAARTRVDVTRHGPPNARPLTTYTDRG